jgi:N-acetylglucosaminyl-diphospho-decaprenol L-rhamnosyltransferase
MDRPRRQLVTVAVVSYNTRELLMRCLDSLAPDAHAGRAEVCVIDNCSTDGSAQAARDRAPWATVVGAERNLGFGGAVNLVAERMRGEWLLAANADVALLPGALDALLRAGADLRVAGVAPRLTLPSGQTQHSVHPLPTVPSTLLFNLGLQRVIPELGDRLCLEGYWDADRARTVPWAIGACLLLRRSAFEEVGGFDEQQWMYAEDIDLQWRLRRHGWHIRYEPAAHVLHDSGASAVIAFGERRESRFLAATYAMLLRRRGRARMWATAAINIAGAGGRVVWMTPLACLSSRWRGPNADNRRWLRAHLEGARMPSRLLSSK